MLHATRIGITAALIGCVVSFGSFAKVATGATKWKDVDGVKVPVPPSHRPRLYLTPDHAAQLPARREHPELAPVVERLRTLARRREQFKLEWDAVEYLISGNRTLGRETVEATLTLLKNSELPDRNDACR